MILAISVDPGTSRMLFKLKSGCLSVGALNPLGNRNGASCRNLDSRERCSLGSMSCPVGRRNVRRGWDFA